MFGIFDLISYTYGPSARNGKTFRKTEGMHGTIQFNGRDVGFESGLEKIFATMMAIDPQVTEIIHQPLTFQYRVTGVDRQLGYTPDYRVLRDTSRKWIWDKSLVIFPADCLFEVKPQKVLDKLPLQTHGAQGSLIKKVQQDGEFGFHIFTNQSIPKFQVENVVRVGNARLTPTELRIGLECVDHGTNRRRNVSQRCRSEGRC